MAYDGAKIKLHEVLDYPEDILDFKYDSNMFRRGLIIDKNRGNFLKLDKHKYVRKATHGLTVLSTDERKASYMSSFQQSATFSENHYVNIDTMFLLVDAVLFAQLVDYKDKNPETISKSYEGLYKDIRHCVDLCHRDGAIKDTVMRDPLKYIIPDDGIVPMLQRYRKTGKVASCCICNHI